MGRGRPSLRLPPPEWLNTPCACKIVWNGIHNELPVTVSEADEYLTASVSDEKRATADLGQIHQAAIVSNDGKALVVSGRGIRSLKRLHSKQLGEIQKKRLRCAKGSRRWRKLGRRGAKLTLRCKRPMRVISVTRGHVKSSTSAKSTKYSRFS
ncbi:hypothetical protein A946_07070, partial [Methylacidiphilum kamchatkense Kam1]